jgi:hypothetical protein
MGRLGRSFLNKKNKTTFAISNDLRISLAQVEDVSKDYYLNELPETEINEILNYPISKLTENEVLVSLKEKTNSNLKTLATILFNYRFAETLNLTIEEQTNLPMRMLEMVDKFYQEKKLVFLENSGGYSPIKGIKEEKKIAR